MRITEVVVREPASKLVNFPHSKPAKMAVSCYFHGTFSSLKRAYQEQP